MTARWLLFLILSVGALHAQTDVSSWDGPRERTPFLDQLERYAPAGFIEQSVVLTGPEVAALIAATDRSRISLPSLDLGLAKGAPMTFRRSQRFAEGARIHVVEATGIRLLPPSDRVFVVGTSYTGSAGLGIDPVTRTVTGLVIDGHESYEVTGQPRDDGSVELQLVSLRDAIRSTPFQCGTDPSHTANAIAKGAILPSRSAIPKGGAVMFQTTVAVDTDTAFTGQPRFGGNAASVRNYIEDLFGFMNAIYERDLGLHLLLGDVFINFASDPYVGSAGLSEFGAFWLQNRSNVDRDFALVLAGIGGGFSGVAWLDAYCDNGRTFGNTVVGSYSFNGIGSSFSASLAAEFVGHELGHNFGSSHTHCERLADGGTSFVDQCYSCEDYDQNDNCQDSCYVGPTSCQPGGTGSVMSYCHAGPTGFDGPGPAAGTTQNCSLTGEFHPLIIDKLEGRLAANNPQCIETFSVGFDLGLEPDQVTVCKPDSAMTVVSVTAGGGFTDSVALSATNEPAGATIEFAPTSIAPGQSATLTISNSAAVADGSYEIQVNGDGGGAQDSVTLSLSVQSGNIAAPTLTGPADDATVATGSPLTWSAVAGASGYTVEIATDPGFNDIVESSSVADTTYEPTLLQTETTYFWRVTTDSACGAGATSASRTFTTASEACASPDIVIGPNGQFFTSSLTVNVEGTLDDLDVSLRIDTTFPDAFDVDLVHTATGTRVFLIDDIFSAGCFGSSSDAIDTRFDDEASVTVLNACLNNQLDNGINVRPSDSLGAFDGLPLAGAWQLTVQNFANSQSGTFEEWCVFPTVISEATTSELAVTVLGAGRITSNPAGLDCSGGTCTAEFEDDQQVTLNAIADEGARFQNWSGDCSGSGPCQVDMSGDRAVSAAFIDDDAVFVNGFEGDDPPP